MSDKNDLGFDILENADINTVEEIGHDFMSIDKDARDRMLKNTMKKYENAKKEQGVESKGVLKSEDYADSVTGVESYRDGKLPRIVYILLSSAAVIALITVGLLVFNHFNVRPPTNPDPIIEVTTATTDISTTGISGTTNSTSKATAKTSSLTTATSDTTSSASTENTSSTTTETTTTVKTDEPSEITQTVFVNPHTDRRDITQEELDSARIRAIEKLVSDGYNGTAGSEEIWYEYVDINGNSIPELFVCCAGMPVGKFVLLVYDGEDYIRASFNGHDYYGNYVGLETAAYSIRFNPEKHIIGILGHQGGDPIHILYLDTDNTITVLDEYTHIKTFKNGRATDTYDDGDDTLEYFGLFCQMLESSYSWKVYEWTKYNE
ncbi:MAG: hypothetical protein J6Y71_03825 [Ruminococcus sp.]|nr:hypothetical protein [Ruminococcus sp.]